MGLHVTISKETRVERGEGHRRVERGDLELPRDSYLLCLYATTDSSLFHNDELFKALSPAK